MSAHPFRLTAARVVRVATVPPVMVAALLAVLFLRRGGVFRSPAEFLLSVLFLAVAPSLAYPISAVIPALRAKGREGQRSLAIVCSIVGYTAAMVYGLLIRAERSLLLIFGAYLFSVLFLTLLNAVVRIRASGHACGITGPLALASYLLGPVGAIVGILLWVLILWASLTSGRHTRREFLFGTLACLAGLLVSLLLFH